MSEASLRLEILELDSSIRSQADKIERLEADLKRETNLVKIERRRSSSLKRQIKNLRAELQQVIEDRAEHYTSELFRIRAEHKAEVARLQAALRWAKPRLSRVVYRDELDRMVSLPPAPPKDEPRIVQSEV